MNVIKLNNEKRSEGQWAIFNYAFKGVFSIWPLFLAKISI